MSNNKEVFWTVLPRLMDIAGLNQTDLAKAVGVSKSTVNCWIKRKSFPEMNTVQKIADALGCRTDDLLIPIPESHRHAAEDLQMKRLWPLAPLHAKRAAIAVLLQLMKDEEEEVLGIDLSEVQDS